jgi:hypothetical protein
LLIDVLPLYEWWSACLLEAVLPQQPWLEGSGRGVITVEHVWVEIYAIWPAKPWTMESVAR